MKNIINKFFIIIISLNFIFLNISCKSETKQFNTLFQVSTINALMHGLYDGVITFEKLKRKGDFGIGTTHALNGEMILLDGIAYKVDFYGKVNHINDNEKTPFAIVLNFKSQKLQNINTSYDLDKLQNFLIKQFISKNYFYAIRIDGTFKKIKLRSVAAQSKPYPLLSDAVKKQSVFILNNIEGTLVGFYCPLFVAGLNVSGYHFHFLSKDKKSGGHVLDLVTDEIGINISAIRNFEILFPDNNEFMNINFAPNIEREIRSVERGR